MEKRLNEFGIGETGFVKAVFGEARVRRRLFDMGVTSGTEITMRRAAPLGDPVWFIVRGHGISMRKDEAALVSMEINLKQTGKNL